MSSSRNAVLVAAGIFLSRVIGFVRERIFAHYLGSSAAADAFKAALKIPNLLQNLFGEGALSASFIPVYARLLAEKEEAEARRVAHVVGSVLAVAMSVLVLAGVLATPLLIGAIAPGFTGEKREATIRMVRVLFPGMGVLVLSAWCLGILNSHRRFFLPYAAPVLWNGSMIAALVFFGARCDGYALAERVAWGAVVGSVLQLAVQLPAVISLAGSLRLELETRSASVRTIFASFFPSLGSRGVTQIAGYVDSFLASFLPTGAVAVQSYAQTLYLLPVALFGTSVASAELPEMSGGGDVSPEAAARLRDRLDAALRRVAVLVVPSAVAFVVLGDVLVATVFQTGKFGRDDVTYVWAVLAGSALGLLPATLARLYATTFWALRDTRTPLRVAIVRVLLGAALGAALAFVAPPLLGLSERWGLAGLTVGAACAAFVELLLLRRGLNARIGRTGLPWRFSATLWGVAGGAAAAAFALERVAAAWPPVVVGGFVCGVYGALYTGGLLALGVPEARSLAGRFRKR